MNPYAKTLRKEATPTEKILWGSLRGRRFFDIKFRRQQKIGPYIVDFFCSDHKLIIEIDGTVHYVDGAQERDRARQDFLEAEGYRVVRFTTDDIQKSLPAVLETISLYLGLTPHPALSHLLPQGAKGLITQTE